MDFEEVYKKLSTQQINNYGELVKVRTGMFTEKDLINVFNGGNELYLRIDKLHAVTDNIKLDDVKEIINQAIEHSEKRASRKLFKGIKKKHTENGDLIYLTESDFRE